MASQKVTCHTRSISLPSQPHPSGATVEDNLRTLRSQSCKEASSSGSSVCQNLFGIKDLYEDLHGLIQLPHNQNILFNNVEVVLEGSLCLLDTCDSTIDVLSQAKDCILDLGSSQRRKNDISSYINSRKKIIKMVTKCFENLKKSERRLEKNGNAEIVIVNMLTEAEAVCFPTLKSILTTISGKKVPKNRWSRVAKLMKPKHASCEGQDSSNVFEKIDHAVDAKRSSTDTQGLLKQLEKAEMEISKLEDGLQSVSRCLVRSQDKSFASQCTQPIDLDAHLAKTKFFCIAHKQTN